MHVRLTFLGLKQIETSWGGCEQDPFVLKST